MRIRDPRTGVLAYVHDEEGYHRELAVIDVECPHDRLEQRKFPNKNGTFAVVNQCLACGERIGNPVKVADRNSVPPADLAIAPTRRKEWIAAREALAAKYIDQSNAKDAQFWKDYDAYLQTPAWKARRAKVLKRCGGICEGCGDRPATVVHHRTYEHVFDELLFELVGLCEPCHQKVHAHADPDNGEGVEPEYELDF